MIPEGFATPVFTTIKVDEMPLLRTGPDGAVVMSSANGLVGTGFASRYLRLLRLLSSGRLYGGSFFITIKGANIRNQNT